MEGEEVMVKMEESQVAIKEQLDFASLSLKSLNIPMDKYYGNDAIRYNSINLNGAVIALFGLAMFSSTQDDVNSQWRLIWSFSGLRDATFLACMVLLSVVFIALAARKRTKAFANDLHVTKTDSESFPAFEIVSDLV